MTTTTLKYAEVNPDGSKVIHTYYFQFENGLPVVVTHWYFEPLETLPITLNDTQDYLGC